MWILLPPRCPWLLPDPASGKYPFPNSLHFPIRALSLRVHLLLCPSSSLMVQGSINNHMGNPTRQLCICSGYFLTLKWLSSLPPPKCSISFKIQIKIYLPWKKCQVLHRWVPKAFLILLEGIVIFKVCVNFPDLLSELNVLLKVPTCKYFCLPQIQIDSHSQWELSYACDRGKLVF